MKRAGLFTPPATFGPHRFQAPLPWLTGSIAISNCGYLFGLPERTQYDLPLWNLLGLAAYMAHRVQSVSCLTFQH